MGLNLERINAIKQNLAKEQSAVVPSAGGSSSVGSTQAYVQATAQSANKDGTLAALAMLSNLSTKQLEEVTAPPWNKPNSAAESAGTIGYQEVADKIAALDANLKSVHPLMPRLLQDIWDTLKKYPENVTILNEDEIERIVAGLEKLVDTDLAAITIKSATSSKKSKVPVTTASLGF
jgi:hypothetical protein